MAELLIALATLATPGLAQDALSGISVPMTLTGSLMHAERRQFRDANASAWAPGFRAAIHPTLKMGRHWFAYGSAQVRGTPFYDYDAFSSKRTVQSDVIQAYLAYANRIGDGSFVVKAGRLNTAFGSFPLRYDDAQNPLFNKPLGYVTLMNVLLRGMPLDGITDYEDLYQNAKSYGHDPVTTYGLWGTEADFSVGRLDARLQLTTSSPANPQPLRSRDQYIQWTAGGGYTWQGLRAGVSAFRGPYLEGLDLQLMPAAHTVRDYPATGLGTDLQYARGRWSFEGEWQHFSFDGPRYRTPPVLHTGYVEAKAILSPRLYLAGRFAVNRYPWIEEAHEDHAEPFEPSREAYEFGGGYRFNRRQLLKVAYQWVRVAGESGTRRNVFGVQLVTTINPLSRTF